MNFDYQLHVFKYPGMESILENAVQFFIQTPVHQLPPPEYFSGPGVYGLYYTGDYKPYLPIATNTYSRPIYIGKAVAPGARTARMLAGKSSNLVGRLQEHTASINSTSNLHIKDFMCRFMVLEGAERDLIVPIESELIRRYRPLWNACISGFGIHTPGSGRFGQQPSEWDTLHPGRVWAKNLTGKARDVQAIQEKIRQFLG